MNLRTYISSNKLAAIQYEYIYCASVGGEAVRVGGGVRKGGVHAPQPRGARPLPVLPAQRDLYAAFATFLLAIAVHACYSGLTLTRTRTMLL